LKYFSPVPDHRREESIPLAPLKPLALLERGDTILTLHYLVAEITDYRSGIPAYRFLSAVHRFDFSG